MPGAPSPSVTRRDGSPISALRGSQLPVKGSALASAGNGALAPSPKQARWRCVALPPAVLGLIKGVQRCAGPPSSQVLRPTLSWSMPSLKVALTQTCRCKGRWMGAATVGAQSYNPPYGVNLNADL